MKNRSVVLYVCFVLAFSFVCQAVFAQDQFINCRKFAAGIRITIDGDSSDWPLSSYGLPAELPDIDPAEQFSDASATINALDQVPLRTGDHFVFDGNKALINAGSGERSFEADGDGDFAATTYIAWDDTGMCVLNVVRDSKIGWFHGLNATRDANNQPAYTSDGIELWFDNDNDRLPPNIQNDTSSQFDLQLDISIDDALIREEFGQEPIMANGLKLEIAIFRSALNTDNEAETAILNQILHAVAFDNPNPDQRTGYTQEIFIPFGTFPSFDAAAPIGFNVNWMDWDDEQFMLCRWHQANESEVQYFREMRFTSNNPLGGTRIYNWSLF